jgi:hypothetical protein
VVGSYPPVMVGDGEIALRRLKKKRILERTVRMYELLEEESSVLRG